jgi:hypothetical protein
LVVDPGGRYLFSANTNAGGMIRRADLDGAGVPTAAITTAFSIASELAID